MFRVEDERRADGDGAVLVHPSGVQASHAEAEELRDLTRSAGVAVVGELNASRRDPDPGHYLGSGKLEELGALRRERDAEVVIFGVPLSPSQERNIERILKCRVLDRTRLILDIFAQRAYSYEGKLQVELAQLEHMSTRLVRGWTHLERQKGGIGLRGPGEKQLETDRRLLNQRVKQIRGRLHAVRARRNLGRRARQRAEVPMIALAGYTNAGKSTLFNRLTAADVLSEDRLFATLDPTMRKVALAGGAAAVLADTVGFVRHLPHELVAAFETTLEESSAADLLLHVVDASDPERAEKSAQVEDVLTRIGADSVPRVVVCNKIDTVDDATPRVDRDASGTPWRVWLSAATGEGVALLQEVLTERLAGRVERHSVLIPWAAGALRARLFERFEIESERTDDPRGWIVSVRASESLLAQVLGGSEAAWWAEAAELGEPEPATPFGRVAVLADRDGASGPTLREGAETGAPRVKLAQ
ncbi:MAG: ribosome rescue GTPase HflX [Pseudomonadota bacterium]